MSLKFGKTSLSKETQPDAGADSLKVNPNLPSRGQETILPRSRRRHHLLSFFPPLTVEQVRERLLKLRL